LNHVLATMYYVRIEYRCLACELYKLSTDRRLSYKTPIQINSQTRIVILNIQDVPSEH